MNLSARIEAAERSLHDALLYLSLRDMSSVPVIPRLPADDQRRLAEKLRGFSDERSKSIYHEIEIMGEAAGHHQRRVSLGLRYRQEIWGEAAQDGANVITQDLNDSVELCQLAESFSHAALSYDPAQDRDKFESTRSGISRLLNEASRFISGIVASPLTEEQLRSLHEHYANPADPAQAYRDETLRLGEGYVAMAEHVTARIKQSGDYASFILKSIVPIFADHAAGMQAQAEEILTEAMHSEVRIFGLLNKSRQFS